jgi:hypothetical protein
MAQYGVCEQIAQTRERYANYRAEMDRDVANSLEVISSSFI